MHYDLIDYIHVRILPCTIRVRIGLTACSAHQPHADCILAVCFTKVSRLWKHPRNASRWRFQRLTCAEVIRWFVTLLERGRTWKEVCENTCLRRISLCVFLPVYISMNAAMVISIVIVSYYTALSYLLLLLAPFRIDGGVRQPVAQQDAMTLCQENYLRYRCARICHYLESLHIQLIRCWKVFDRITVSWPVARPPWDDRLQRWASRAARVTSHMPLAWTTSNFLI